MIFSSDAWALFKKTAGLLQQKPRCMLSSNGALQVVARNLVKIGEFILVELLVAKELLSQFLDGGVDLGDDRNEFVDIDALLGSLAFLLGLFAGSKDPRSGGLFPRQKSADIEALVRDERKRS